jgi:tetratricopeptide (TPR) repeat protein
MVINMKVLYFFLFPCLISCHDDQKVVNKKTEIYLDHFKSAPKNTDSLKTLSIQAGLTGDFNKMKKLCEMVYSLDSLDADNLSRLSGIYLIEKKYLKALEYIDKSIKLDTGDYLKHNITFKAFLLYELKREDSSAHYFSKMREINTNAESISALVEAFNTFKLFDKAIEYNSIAYKYYPTDLKVNYYQANILVYQKKYKEALAIFNKIQPRVKDDPNFYFSRGACYMYMNEYDKALKDVTAGRKLSSEDVRFITASARIYQKMGKFKEAEKNYKIAISKNDTVAVRLYNSLLKEKNNK